MTDVSQSASLIPTSDGGAAFTQFLATKRTQIDTYVQSTTPRISLGEKPGVPAHDLDSFLYTPLQTFTAWGGKRTRPALCLLGAAAVGGNEKDALDIAAAIEDFQSAALIHDDIADQSELRRGKPCVHQTQGVGIAITIGDLALVNVVARMIRATHLSDATKVQLVELLCQMEERTLEGQALDLGWARDDRWDISQDDYLYMASHKTAYYSAATPLVAGALCTGDATDRQLEALHDFGMKTGLAFQLQDDLLNLVGDATAQGKDWRSDITEGKRTLCVVHALSELNSQNCSELIEILSSNTSDPKQLAHAVELMEQAGSITHVQNYAQTLVDDAKTVLTKTQLAPEALTILYSMADFFIERLG
ncbi:polyprenyl synthetase family protein [Atopobium fossor]|uniref:polyprenyl synthetase family protein n=1 Tax=Atopobium fossor TaxID=39487 RepID=UPI0003FF2100|nr:polyprenyl synthetase family protein [Atopobium fossor]